MNSTYTESVLELTEEHFEALNELGTILLQRQLSFIERNAAERSIQVVAEACIGLAKHICKKSGRQVLGDTSASTQKAVEILQATQKLEERTPKHLLGAIGMRNAIVHDYLNLDWDLVAHVITNQDYLKLKNFIQAASIYLSEK
jgi:uncharacterized protein YutE (UPF0331/DUF86 family)